MLSMTNVKQVPREPDWVSVCFECSAIRIFRELCEGIEADVEAINQIKDMGITPFGANLTRDKSTIVVGQYNVTSPRPRVSIGVVDDRIVVRDEASQREWSATVRVNNEGRCTLRLESGVELEQWQFRMGALQDLSFLRR